MMLTRWQRMTSEQKQATLERVRRWKAANPEKVRQSARQSYQRIKTTRRREFTSSPCVTCGRTDVLLRFRGRTQCEGCNSTLYYRERRAKDDGFRQRANGHTLTWKYRNLEKFKATNAAWRRSDQGRQSGREASRRWIRTHPEVNRSHASAYRAKKRANGVEKVDLKAIWEASNKMCVICRKRIAFKDRSFDHIIPIARGGPHAASNIQVTHRSCNSKRGVGRIPAQIKMLA